MGRTRTWTDDQLIEAVQNNYSFSNTLRALGLSTSGGHFYQVKTHIKRLELDTSHWHAQTHTYSGALIRTETTKRCSICKEFKSFDQFFKANSSKDGYSAWCKDCKRERQRTQQWAKNHGMTQEQYDLRVKEQNGRCAICKRTPEHNRWKRLYVDHRHSDNAPRGLLCSSCNQAIGLFQDDPDLLDTAATYLRSW